MLKCLSELGLRLASFLIQQDCRQRLYSLHPLVIRDCKYLPKITLIIVNNQTG